LALAKLAMILIFILYTSPTSCHALCRAAAYAGVHPMHGEQALDDAEDTSSKT
jgi:multisubunit Na+/H+ antiporter MnhG subunit